MLYQDLFPTNKLRKLDYYLYIIIYEHSTFELSTVVLYVLVLLKCVLNMY